MSLALRRTDNGREENAQVRPVEKAVTDFDYGIGFFLSRRRMVWYARHVRYPVFKLPDINIRDQDIIILATETVGIMGVDRLARLAGLSPGFMSTEVR